MFSMTYYVFICNFNIYMLIYTNTLIKEEVMDLKGYRKHWRMGRDWQG